MAIPSRQIGQPSSTKAQLLWNISKQLDYLTKVAGNVYIPTTPVISPVWSFIPGVSLTFPTNQDGYMLYDEGWTSYDDGNTTSPISFAGTFNSGNQSDTQYYLSTNGYFYGVNGDYQFKGNQQDLFLTPGESLDNGDIQNFWYKNTSDNDKWKTSILVYCGHCCGSPQQQTPYSYMINVYKDNQYQYVETICKDNTGGDAGPQDVTYPSSNVSQVWRSDVSGNNWEYLGFGSIEGTVSNTITIYSQELSFPISYASMVLTCDGNNTGNYMYTNQTANDINELVNLFNANAGTNVYGTFAAATSTVLQLTTQTIVKNINCPNGTLGINVFQD